MTDYGPLLAVCLIGGVVAGFIALVRTGRPAQFVGYFFFGVFLPLIGIIFACLAKPPPQPPSWRPDPWRQAPLRWYDGTAWTYHLSTDDGTVERRGA